MRKYIFELEINEGNDEFWEELKGKGTLQVAKIIKRALENYGFFFDKNGDCSLKIKSFQSINKEFE